MILLALLSSGGLSAAAAGSTEAAALNAPVTFDALGDAFRAFALVLGLLFTLMLSSTASSKLGAEVFGTLMVLIVGLMIVSSADDLVLLRGVKPSGATARADYRAATDTICEEPSKKSALESNVVGIEQP